jgi:diguanylate cyclase (GGDEF)-like protein
MMDDTRLAELAFLQRIVTLTNNGHLDNFYANHEQWRSLGLAQQHFIEMVIHLLENGAIRYREERMQLLVARLRHEYSGVGDANFTRHEWDTPRRTLERSMLGTNVFTLAITYTGLRRIEDLRDQLKQDRILDPLGVLLDWRYFLPELRLALGRSDNVPVSVIALDLDGFKAVNDAHGHDAGDAVLRSYMQAVKDIVDTAGTAFRRGGDEVHVLLPGSDRDQSRKLADVILYGVRSMKVQFKGKDLPRVSSSIGVASSPPDSRSPDLDGIADQRQLAAKKAGKDRVVDQG